MLWQPKYQHYPHFSTRVAVIERQLFAPLSVGEIVVLLFHLYFLFVTLQIRAGDVLPPTDYNAYMRAALGDTRTYYYAYWLLPVYSVFATLPGQWGYIFWTICFLAGIIAAARVFGGRSALPFLTYQMIYALFYGQIAGILLGALALAWWAMAKRRWYLAGVFFLIAGGKLQLGAFFAAFLFLLADISWRNRFRVLLIPAFVVLLSFAVYGNWIEQVLISLRDYPVNDMGSLAPWRWIGPWALLIWIPPLIVRLPKQRRLIALVCAMMLGVPYFQQADLLALFVLPVGWLPLLGNFGILYNLPEFGWAALQNLWIIPLIAYLWMIVPAVRDLVRRKST